MAYCLVGIFDLNMPLLSGEGRKVFRRLQEAVIRRHNDHPVVVYMKTPAQLSRDALFVEYPNEVLKGAALRPNKQTPPFYLTNAGLSITTQVILCPAPE
jgi:hypothetical protein